MTTKKLNKYKWLVLPILYLAICIWTYFTATLEIEGVALPQHEAGMWGIIILHVMILLAGIGALALHYLIEAFNWVLKKLFK